MNQPLFNEGDRLPGTIGIVIDVYCPYGQKDYFYTIAFGTNHLKMWGYQLCKYFPEACKL